MKILTVIGARPQFVKAAVLSRAFSKIPDIQEVLAHTGQHYDDNMSAVFFRELSIEPPKINLGIREDDPVKMVSGMMEALAAEIKGESPDCVLVYGDTYSTLAGALAARFCNVPLAHVEAGLRNNRMEVPEEFNRVVTDRISKYLFCPTQIALENLKLEGFDKMDVSLQLSGDVMYDASLYFSGLDDARNPVEKVAAPDQYLLCTIHRAENTDDPERLRTFFKELDKLHSEIPVLLPLHPRTRKRMKEFGISSSVSIIDPVGYLDMMHLLKNCRLVITDSGGLQKEAYFHRKHVVVLREATEWKELTEHGYACLSGYAANSIYEAVQLMLMKKSEFLHKFYGDGKAGDRIAEFFKNKML